MRDHPRACGEKGNPTDYQTLVMGSPPRVRGKVLSATGHPVLPRITPARAGKRGNCLESSCKAWDHPRACGEKIPMTRIVEEIQGSPPRVRGKATKGAGNGEDVGITPARAGKRRRRERNVLRCRDHPRACGEKGDAMSVDAIVQGSPPRVRGKVPAGLESAFPNGITPARAGKRRRRDYHSSSSGDHPRACGEKTPERRLWTGN